MYDWEKKYVSALKGGKIVSTGVTSDGFPYFEVEKGRGATKVKYRVEVSQDPEGNGPGFLFGLPMPR